MAGRGRTPRAAPGSPLPSGSRRFATTPSGLPPFPEGFPRPGGGLRGEQGRQIASPLKTRPAAAGWRRAEVACRKCGAERAGAILAAAPAWWGTKGARPAPERKYKYNVRWLKICLSKCQKGHLMPHLLLQLLQPKCPAHQGLWDTIHTAIWPTTTTGWEGTRAPTAGSRLPLVLPFQSPPNPQTSP